MRSAVVERGASPARIRQLLPSNYELVQEYPVRIISGNDESTGVHSLDYILALLQDEGIEAQEVYG